MPGTSMVISMRLPTASGERLKRMANRFGWTPSEASARLVEEGIRRSEFAFVDFRDSGRGRQACMQGSSLGVWEVMAIARDHKLNKAAIARHLGWPETKVQAAFNYAKAFPEEIEAAIADNDAADFGSIQRMLPQATEFLAGARCKKS
jgi:hypothetical protein